MKKQRRTGKWVTFTRAPILELRRSLWHLRKGGVPELRRHWRNISGIPRINNSVWASGHFPNWEWPEQSPKQRVKVAIIADDFTLGTFRYEWEQVELFPRSWQKTLEKDHVDLLFVESAWSGNHGAWKYHFTGPSAPRPEIVQLTQWCREHGIPTVFWNKEDPVHFDDFLDTARLFDWVFTTDVTCVDRYRQALGHDRVRPLPFAVPTAICNPVRPYAGFHSRGPAFAGTWYGEKFPERREQLAMLLDAAMAVENPEKPLEIYSRFLGQDAKYQFPERFSSHIAGSLTYDEILSAYRAHSVFLNVNTVQNSPTMCARRVLEITACGTPVVSTPAQALSTFLGEHPIEVHTANQAQEALELIATDEMATARIVHMQQRHLWTKHTYSHRVAELLETLHIEHRPIRRPSVSVICSTKRMEQIPHLLEQVSRQAGCDVELILGLHGGSNVEGVQQKASDLGLKNLDVYEMDGWWSLGTCLNFLISHSSGEVIAKFDDDDFYGAHYLVDQLDALMYSNADLVGKHARFVYLEGSGVTTLTMPKHEQLFTRFVAGPTLMSKREVFIQFPFADRTHGEDSDFLQRLIDQHLRIFASDRFNFMQYRGAHPGSHTWQSEDQVFLKTATWTKPGMAWTEIQI